MLGYGSGFYNISLSAYYTLVIVYNWWKEYQLKKVRLWLLCLPIVGALALACSALPHYAHVWIGCWLRPEPFSVNSAASDFTIPPIAIVTIITTACQIRVYFSVRATFRKAERWSMNKRLKKKKAEGGVTADPSSSTFDPGKSKFQTPPSSTFDPRNSSTTQQTTKEPRRKCCQNAVLFQDNAKAAVFWQSAFYLFIYYLCWPILGMAVRNGGSQSYGFWLTFAALAPLQGFLNCLIYFRPRYVSWRKARKAARERQRRNSRKNKISGLGMSTSTSSTATRTTTASGFRWGNKTSSQKGSDSTPPLKEGNNVPTLGGSKNTPDHKNENGTERTEQATCDENIHDEDQAPDKATCVVPKGSAWDLNVHDGGKDVEEKCQHLNASDRGKDVEEQPRQDSIVNQGGNDLEEESQQVAEEEYTKTYPSLS